MSDSCDHVVEPGPGPVTEPGDNSTTLLPAEESTPESDDELAMDDESSTTAIQGTSKETDAFKKTLRKYNLKQKEELGRLCALYKVDYDAEVAAAPLVWDTRRRRHLRRMPKEGFKSKAVRKYFPSLRDISSLHPEFKQAISLANRCYEFHLKKQHDGILDVEETNKKAFRAQGGGRKAIAPEVRQAAFEWFIDVRGTLKGRLPRKIFKLKCEELYQQWVQAQNHPITKPLQFSDHWVNSWMKEYRVSLVKPNKRFAISQAERVLRLLEFLKNMWRARYFFIKHFNKEPVVINGDQMPLHRNESASQKTMTMTGQPTYVKENYMLSRERVTVFTQISTDERNKMPMPEFVFKGKGTRTHLNKPDGMYVQWTPKGSYRLDTMLETINHLPNRYNMFTQRDYAVYVLDDYSVHVTNEVKKAFLARGYILICIGGGITGDIQVNDTHVHHLLKKEYRDLEAKLMLEQLVAEPHKVPSPSRDSMMKMLADSWTSLTIDPVLALKNNFIINAFDGSEDYLVSDKLFELIGAEMVTFRKDLLSKPAPATIKELMQTITAPKGVKIKHRDEIPPPDEGQELLDCDGDEIEENEMELELNSEHHSVEDVCENPASTASTSIMSSTQKSHATNTTSSTVQLSHVSSDKTINADCAFLDDMKELFEKHSTSTSKLFIPHFCQFKATYSRARLSLKKRIISDHNVFNRQDKADKENEDEIDIDTNDADVNVNGISSDATDGEKSDRSESVPMRIPLEVGSYVMIANGQNQLPACVVQTNPLAVRYFEIGQSTSNLYRAAEYTQEVLEEDVARHLEVPTTVPKGSRIYYAFKL